MALVANIKFGCSLWHLSSVIPMLSSLASHFSSDTYKEVIEKPKQVGNAAQQLCYTTPLGTYLLSQRCLTFSHASIKKPIPEIRKKKPNPVIMEMLIQPKVFGLSSFQMCFLSYPTAFLKSLSPDSCARKHVITNWQSLTFNNTSATFHKMNKS